MNRKILVGDVLARIKDIPDKSIDCVITSPPYFGLRSYDVNGQWGLEQDFQQYLDKLGRLMDELKRVLKDTGTVWINLGDSYGGSGKGAGTKLKTTKRVWEFDKRPKTTELVKAKSRMGIPERFYINCIDNGWLARNNIVWAKNNAMPEAVKDRFSTKYESIFFFAKQKNYYFNLDAVREKHLTATTGTKRDKFIGKASKEYLQNWQKNEDSIHKSNAYNPKGKNPGDIFQINTTPYPEAHFATFPEALPTKILKCACKPGDIVLDPFFGSGTTGVAAEKLGIRWIGIELNKEYVMLAEKRLHPYVFQTRLEKVI